MTGGQARKIIFCSSAKALCLFIVAILIFKAGYVNCTYSEGLSINTFDGLVLNTLNVDCLIKQNGSIAFSFQSLFTARGTEPTLKILFYTGESIPSNIGNASIIVDTVIYYRPNGTKILEAGTFYEHLLIEPQELTNAIFYDIDLKNVTVEVFNHFSVEQPNVTLNDVVFYGSLSLGMEFENATGIVSSNGYFGFTPSLDGNMTSVILDTTIPEEYDLVTYKFGGQDMTKVFPNRVQESFSVAEGQGTKADLYLEWRIPTVTVTPWYVQYPYNLIIAAIISLVVGWLSRYSYDIFKARREKKRNEPVKNIVARRIETDLKLLAAWIEMIAYEKHGIHRAVVDRIRHSKDGLITSANLGAEVITPNIKQGLLELDRRLESLINVASAREHFSDNMWFDEIDGTLSQVVTLFDLLESDDSIAPECWLEVFREKRKNDS